MSLTPLLQVIERHPAFQAWQDAWSQNRPVWLHEATDAGLPALVAALWRRRRRPLLWITETYSKATEDFIRVAPEQYLWIHRRWKSRPKEERAELWAANAPL